MNTYIIISTIIFILMVIFGITKIKKREKEYGEELKDKNNTNLNQKTPEEIAKNKKQTLIALIIGLLVMLIGVLVVFLTKKDGSGGSSNKTTFFPFWLIAIIPILTAQKKKKLENINQKEIKTKLIILSIIGLLFLLGILVLFFTKNY